MRPQFSLRFRRNTLATPARSPIAGRPLDKVRADFPRKDRALKPQRDAVKADRYTICEQHKSSAFNALQHLTITKGML
jgi:hypothetical protein